MFGGSSASAKGFRVYPSQRTHKRSYGKYLLALTALFSLAYFYGGINIDDSPAGPISPIPSRPFNELDLEWVDYPPTYKMTRETEKNLPQHNLDLPFPEGKKGRYVKFSNEIQMGEWGIVLNERLMNTFLAHESNRAYVFSDHLWNRRQYPWPAQKILTPIKPITAPVTPLSAFISGPTVGGPWEAGDNAPRSINEQWWEVVCPRKIRRIINTGDIKPKLGEVDGMKIFETWKKLLLNAQEECIEIQAASISEDDHPQVFDAWLWGSESVLSLWESFSTSPVSQFLGGSSIVERAIDVNRYVFYNMTIGADVQKPDPYKQMLVVQLRVGETDLQETCTGLSNWNSTYYGWNLHPSLLDKFVPPSGGKVGKNTKDNVAMYMKHCAPSAEDILEKIRTTRKHYLEAIELDEGEKENLDIIYLVTPDNHNDDLEKIKKTLKTQGWVHILTKQDLAWDRETKDVYAAVEEEMARRASVFIGSGWSPFSSNVMHRRLIGGRVPMSNRLF